MIFSDPVSPFWERACQISVTDFFGCGISQLGLLQYGREFVSYSIYGTHLIHLLLSYSYQNSEQVPP